VDIAIGIVVALLVTVIGLRLGMRRAERRLPPELAEALRLDRTDRSASQHLMDDYFMRQATEDSKERALLWERAPTDLDAAVELRRRLLDDIAASNEARRELNKASGSRPQALSDIELDRQQARTQIARLDAFIERLRLR
jgi:hypothetical protein